MTFNTDVQGQKSAALFGEHLEVDLVIVVTLIAGNIRSSQLSCLIAPGMVMRHGCIPVLTVGHNFVKHTLSGTQL